LGKLTLTPQVMTLVAERFKALGEPARLQILNCLRAGEMAVNDLVRETSFGQANVSKHLQLLHAMGFVRRRKEGLFVYYALADKRIFQLCDTMCGRVEQEMKRHRRLLAG